MKRRAFAPRVAKGSLICAILVGSIAFVAAPRAAPTSFQLVFNGSHIPADYPSPIGLAHVGPFTTSSPLCPSGYGRDIAQRDQVATRLFTCDGSGAQFTAIVQPHIGEHGGQGSWQIISGTGPLADLRGKGSWRSVRLSGSDPDEASITFQSTWQGVVDLDASPPTFSVRRASIHKLARKRTYLVRLQLVLSDGNTNPVSYTLLLIDPRDPADPLVRRSGRATGGSLTVGFRIHPRARPPIIQLKIKASDPLGNTATLSRSIRVP